MIARLLLILTAGALAFAIPFALLTYAHSEPSTEALEMDLWEVDGRIAELEIEASRYSGGAVLSLIEMRRQLLGATRDMLLQKRASVLRRVALQYTIDGEAKASDPERLAEIDADIQTAANSASESEAEAALYSGGLIQSLALMKAATHKVSIAQLQMVYLFEKYGISVVTSGNTTPAKLPNVVPDGDAL